MLGLGAAAMLARALLQGFYQRIVNVSYQQVRHGASASDNTDSNDSARTRRLVQGARIRIIVEQLLNADDHVVELEMAVSANQPEKLVL